MSITVPTSSEFEDIAESIGISDPGFIEKDYHIVQLIQGIQNVTFRDYDFVFSGGTCLSKAYKKTFRISEDVDIKIIPKKHVRSSYNKSQTRRIGSFFTSEVKKWLDSLNFFNEFTNNKQNNNTHQVFEIKYNSQIQQTPSATRDHIKLEFVCTQLLAKTCNKDISSIYSEELKLEPEISAFPCDAIESIASEKFISLLRRVAKTQGIRSDRNLVRHVYDLHLVREEITQISMSDIINKVIKMDQKRFSSKTDKHFNEDPLNELRRGYQMLLDSAIYQEEYEKFVQPLTYHLSPPAWAEAIQTIEKMVEEYLT